MGKGDMRSAKGKRFRGSFGNTRPQDKKRRKARKARQGQESSEN